MICPNRPQPVESLEGRRRLAQPDEPMSEERAATATQTKPDLAAWNKIEQARHPQRPYPMELIERIFTDFSEIHGDRAFSDDEAVACGMARLNGEEVLVIGNRKGGTTRERVRRNFGMPNPDGYRKALRAMKIAEKFARPVISFIDLPGAYPGVAAEERGQAEAIARNLREMSRLRMPTIAVITGEGGSGGALALAVTDRVLILGNALYSVISPEQCAVIMWRDAAYKEKAAEALRLMAPDVMSLGCVDEVISEPATGIHADRDAGVELLAAALRKHLAELKGMTADELVAARQRKFRNIGQFYTEG
jgi:acetyl-CoA carboxylase carboxyl transferase subunit alpha